MILHFYMIWFYCHTVDFDIFSFICNWCESHVRQNSSTQTSTTASLAILKQKLPNFCSIWLDTDSNLATVSRFHALRLDTTSIVLCQEAIVLTLTSIVSHLYLKNFNKFQIKKNCWIYGGEVNFLKEPLLLM